MPSNRNRGVCVSSFFPLREAKKVWLRMIMVTKDLCAPLIEGRVGCGEFLVAQSHRENSIYAYAFVCRSNDAASWKISQICTPVSPKSRLAFPLASSCIDAALPFTVAASPASILFLGGLRLLGTSSIPWPRRRFVEPRS